MFLVLLNYIKPLEQIDNLLVDHLKFLNHFYEQSKFIFSGRKNPRTGGVILVNTNSEKEVRDIMSQDPFIANGVAEFQLIDFTPTLYDARFKSFIR